MLDGRNAGGVWVGYGLLPAFACDGVPLSPTLNLLLSEHLPQCRPRPHSFTKNSGRELIARYFTPIRTCGAEIAMHSFPIVALSLRAVKTGHISG
jgi:hypothetical protein